MQEKVDNIGLGRYFEFYGWRISTALALLCIQSSRQLLKRGLSSRWI
jgi:hypothetical protein